MFRFTIRDVLWLTGVVALGLGWCVDHRRARIKSQVIQRNVQFLQEHLEEGGWQIKYDSNGRIESMQIY